MERFTEVSSYEPVVNSDHRSGHSNGSIDCMYHAPLPVLELNARSVYDEIETAHFAHQQETWHPN